MPTLFGDRPTTAPEPEAPSAIGALLLARTGRSEFWGPTRIIFGWGAAAELSDLVPRAGHGRTCLVVDRNVLASPAIARAVRALQADRDVIVLEHDGSEPVLETVLERFDPGRQEISSVVGIGGGSTLDTAKAVALLACDVGDLAALEGADRVNATPAPLIAVPTTAGTGSEVTGSCVLHSLRHDRKISIRSRGLQPQVALLDPELLGSAPRSVIRSSGVDALAHAAEAYFSTGGNVLTDTLALGALRLVAGSLRDHYQAPSGRPAAEAMAWGSCIAGIAFNSARVGIAHAIASAIGPLTGLPHGFCVGLALPRAVELNLGARPTSEDEFLAALRIAPGGGAATARAAAWLRALYRTIEMPWTAAEVDRAFPVDDVLVERIVRGGRLATNPVAVDGEAMQRILRDISDGSR